MMSFELVSWRFLMTSPFIFPPADAALIRQYATEKGLSVSELIRRCVLKRIEDEFDLETYRKVWKPTKPCLALTRWTKSNLKF